MESIEKKEEVEEKKVKTMGDEMLDLLRFGIEKQPEPIKELLMRTIEGIKSDLESPRHSLWITSVREDGDVTMHIFPTENNIKKTFSPGGIFEKLPERIKNTILAVTPEVERQSFFNVIEEFKKSKVEIKEKEVRS